MELAESTSSGYCPSCLLREALEGEPGEEPQNSTTREPAAGIFKQKFVNYELLEKIGQGGMGVVYKARQINLDRIVALKLLPFGQFSNAEVVQRFKAEAAAAAGLQHPNIVAIHDVGEEGGQHYFSMDFIAGETLAEIVRERPLPAKRAATYLKTIAEAVHYAHQRGILHRDLKPSNILIDSSDQPRITDFGLAKRLTVDSDMTLTGQVLGSPNFMAPEQAEGRLNAIGPATEVYSLGALLYHLVTRQPPFQGDTLTTLLKQVIETDPVPPRLLNPNIPKDLETICLKCLEKDARRRYRTALALAEDLGRFLAGQAVLARPVGVAGKTWRWCRRQPVRAGLIAGLVLVFLAGSIGVLWQWQQARRNAQAETRQRQLASRAAYNANISLAETLINEGQFDRAREILLSTPESYRSWEWGWLQKRCNQDRLTLSWTNATPYFAVFSPDLRLLAIGGDNSEIHLCEFETGRQLRTLRGHTGVLIKGSFSPDSRRFASAAWTRDTTARIWDVGTGEMLLGLQHPSGVKDIRYSPDGKRLVTACLDGKVRLWDAASGQLTGQSTASGDYVECAAFSPDGQHVAYCGGYIFWGSSLDTSVRIWDVGSGQIKKLEGHSEEAYALAWSPNGDLLASAGLDGQVKLWDPDSGLLVGTLESTGERKYALGVAFSPDGQFLAVCGGKTMSLAPWAEIFDLKTRRPLRELTGQSTANLHIAFSADGRWIATASLDGTVKVWPLEPPPPALRLEGHDQVICAVAFSPDGHLVASGSFDQTARIWDAETGLTLQTITVGFPLLSLAFSPDGKDLVTPGPDDSACVWRLQVGSSAEPRTQASEPLKRLLGHKRAVLAVACSPDGKWLATGSKDCTARIWAASTGGEHLRLVGHEGFVTAVAFAPPDGRFIATGSADATIRFWDTRSGDCLQVLQEHTGPVLCLAFSSDGEWLASGSADSTVKVWETRTGRSLVALKGHPHPVTGVTFSPDGQRLVTAAGHINLHNVVKRDFQVRLWDRQSGHQLLALIPHTNSVFALAFSPDGGRLATASFDNSLIVQSAFPWRSGDYPGDSRTPLATRIEQYKRQLWRSAEGGSGSGGALPQIGSHNRRIVRSWLGEISLPPAGSKTVPLRPIPPRPENAGSNQLDLANRYNVALNESWQGVQSLDQADLCLATFPAGCQRLAGVLFDARGLVQLRRAAPDCEQFPEHVGVPCKRAFQRLHCLHGTREDAEQNTAVAAFVLHYVDGTSVEFSVCYGVHLVDVDTPSASGCPQGRVAWKAPKPPPGESQPALYLSTFENPNPNLEVLEIEYVSKMTRSGPFLVALTLE